MASANDGGAAPEPQGRPAGRNRSGEARAYGEKMLRNVVLLVAAAVIVVAIGYALAAFVPRWWAQWIGRRVDGSFTAGVVWGLFLGSVCTFFPLLIAWQAVVRTWIKGWWKAVLVVVALVVALPNLMTLSIVLGTSSGAHAGERILDVDGPAFRAASLWGAILGALMFVALAWLTRTNRERGRRVKDLNSEIIQRDQAERNRGDRA